MMKSPQRFLAPLVTLVLLSAACGEDSSPGPDDTSDTGVYVSSEAGLGWTVEEITYAQGLSHKGDFNAEDAEPVDLVGDLYLPEGVDGLRPALLIVHGGGFLGGTRKQNDLVSFAQFFAARGWVVLSIDYRLANDFGTSPQSWVEMVEREADSSLRQKMGKAIYPAVRDAKAAVRWLQANAESHRLSKEHIAVMGGSAGAHVSVALGVSEPTEFRDELSPEQDPTLETAHLHQTGRVAAVLDFWGGSEAVSGLEQAFGATAWDESDAPILIVHGTDDSLVPVEEGQGIRDAYEASGAPYTYVELDGASHGAWGASVEGQNLRQVSRSFLHEHMELVDRDAAE